VWTHLLVYKDSRWCHTNCLFTPFCLQKFPDDVIQIACSHLLVYKNSRWCHTNCLFTPFSLQKFPDDVIQIACSHLLVYKIPDDVIQIAFGSCKVPDFRPLYSGQHSLFGQHLNSKGYSLRNLLLYERYSFQIFCKNCGGGSMEHPENTVLKCKNLM